MALVYGNINTAVPRQLTEYSIGQSIQELL